MPTNPTSASSVTTRDPVCGMTVDPATAQHKYLANFSIFQSLPDTWSIDHVFPAAPLSRHGERPTLQT